MPYAREFRERRRTVQAVLALGMAAAGCNLLPGSQSPSASWPTEPERLPASVPTAPDAELTCGGERAFDAGVLDHAGGAEDGQGAEIDGLRRAFSRFGDAFPKARRLDWILADRDETGALFVARAEVERPAWLAVELEVDTDTGLYLPMTMSQCDPHVRLSADFGPGVWAIDSAYPSPGPESQTINVLVWEVACNGGVPTTGRMSPAVVAFADDTVTVTIGVRPLEGFQECPLGPGTPAIVTLPQRIGPRELLDGGAEPPRPPAPP